MTVLFVDLDKLKDVNDTIGHSVGDQLIVNMSKRLVSATRPSDVVARIGGDEFVILCDGLGDEQVAMDVANRMRTAVTGEQILQGSKLRPAQVSESPWPMLRCSKKCRVPMRLSLCCITPTAQCISPNNAVAVGAKCITKK